MEQTTLARRATAEALGTLMLLAAVVGSGIMGERLAGGNPAVTLALSMTDTFVGIRPVDVPLFIVAELAGGFSATALFRWLVPTLSEASDPVVMPHERDQ